MARPGLSILLAVLAIAGCTSESATELASASPACEWLAAHLVELEFAKASQTLPRPDFGELQAGDNCAVRRGSLVAYLNHGRGFVSSPLALRRGPPAVSTMVASAMPGQPPQGDWDRYSELRLLDYDRDGRVDLVARERSGTALYRRVFWNRGDTLDTPASALSPFERLSDATKKATFNYAIDRAGALGWAVQGDVIDLTGNGLPELVSEGRVWSEANPRGDTPRLLAAIDSGRGRTTELRYAPHTTFPAVAGRDMPSPVWVVASVTTSDASSQVAERAVSYEYRGPVYNQDDRGGWGFRGFDEVTTRTTTGSRVVEHYDYDLDWSGRLVRRCEVWPPTRHHLRDTGRFATGSQRRSHESRRIAGYPRATGA